MSDERDIIERIENTWRNWNGEDWSPDKTVQSFQLYGPAKRSAALDMLDNEMADVEPTETNMRRYLELAELRQQLDSTHHALRKVGR